ncbi:MAG: AAA family ATPase, partial [Loktanella sp.]|nr:AAA family ATPase [Loktanella sp.]
MTQPNTDIYPADPTNALPSPVWLPLAADLITRLRLHHGHQTQKISSAIDRGAFDEDAEEDETLRGVFDRFQADQAGTEAHVSKPVTPIPPRQLLTAIRLAVAFQTKEALAASRDPRALTILMDIDAKDVDLVSEVLKNCFHHYAWVQLSPSMSDGTVSKSQAERFWASVATAMDGYSPTLLIMPAGLTIPAYLRHAGLPTFRLPSLSADILLAHLRAGELGDAITDEAAFRQALPSDALLAGLSTAEACTAMRAPSIAEVFARLAAMTQSDKTDVPRLEEMTGDSPALLAARRLISDLLLWKDGRVAWSDLSRSILFYGPPGTGKTFLARAMGNSAGLACVTGSFAEWQAAGHLGDMLREMRKTFAEARRQAPAILFIDEIDAVGSRESDDRHGSSYRTQVINGFLGEMNAITLEEGLIVVGACNHIDKIDPAVLRAGRFDIKVAVPMPDAGQILGLMRRLLQGEIPEADLGDLSRAAVGHSPAAIDAAIRAARSDARHTGTKITAASLRAHLSLSTDTDPRILWRVALHEAGHATIAAALHLGQITRLAITPQGGETHR